MLFMVVNKELLWPLKSKKCVRSLFKMMVGIRVVEVGFGSSNISYTSVMRFARAEVGDTFNHLCILKLQV